MKTNVKSTSIEAYHTHDKQTQAYKIALAMQEATKRGKPSTLNTLYRETGIFPSTVSARLNDIKNDGIELDGLPYTLKEVGKMRDPQTMKTVTVWALVVDRAKQAVQVELF